MQLAIDFKDNQTYIVAVSGGVDSVVLLNLLVLQKTKNTCLIVAHLDHGIREQSAKDASFVQKLALKYDLQFELQKVDLSSKDSEAWARLIRYRFLKSLRDRYQATAVITAHHQDDLLETVIFNFYRGSHRRGYSSLKSQPQLLRPLLSFSKQQILDYAQQNKLSWCEDLTNYSLRYSRNFIRHRILPQIPSKDKKTLISLVEDLTQANLKLDDFLNEYLKFVSYRRQGLVYARFWFNRLTHLQACEVVVAWLIKFQISNYSFKQINYIVVKLKTLKAGKRVIVGRSQSIYLTKRSIRLQLSF